MPPLRTLPATAVYLDTMGPGLEPAARPDLAQGDSDLWCGGVADRPADRTDQVHMVVVAGQAIARDTVRHPYLAHDVEVDEQPQRSEYRRA